MAYGHDLGLFAGSGPARPTKSAPPRSSARAYAAWRNLDRDRRLTLVDRALNAGSSDASYNGCLAAL